MKQVFKFSSLFLACSLALTGCGGSGSSNSGPAPTSITATHTAIFSDAPVIGLTYKASPSNISGTTNAKGEFDYKTGDSVTFSVAGITLGTVSNLSATSTSSSPAIITPINLVAGATDASNPTVIAIGQLLGALNSVAVSAGQGVNGMFVVPTATGPNAAIVTALLDKLQSANLTTSTLATALAPSGLIQTAIVAAGGTVPTATSTQSNIAHAACVSTTPALQQAKDFIISSNNIFANSQKVFETYRPTSLTGMTELSESVSVVNELARYAYEQADGGSLTLTPTEMQSYIQSKWGDSIITNLNGLSVSANAGKVTISGSFSIKLQTGYAYTDSYTPIYSNPTTATVKNFVVQAPTSTTTASTYNAQIDANSEISTVTEGQTTTLLAGANSTMSLSYSGVDSLQNRIDTAQIPDSGQMSLANISITSAGTKISLDQLTLKAQKVKYTVGGGAELTSFVPTSLIFKGSASQATNTAAIEATINLNNDLSKTFAFDGTTKDKLENSLNFIQSDFTLKVSTTINTPTQSNVITAAFTGSRTQLDQGQATFDLTVNNDKLSGLATYMGYVGSAQHPENLEVILNNPNNCARTFIPNILNFTTSNITVNGIVQGTISKSSNSVYQAIFNDNSIIVIAP